MRKSRLFILIVSLLVISGAAVGGLAQSPEALIDLARYYPADAPVFGVVRTDDAYLDTLDALTQRLELISEGEFDLPLSLHEMLDYGAGELVEGGTFENVVRAWLGDTVAIGAVNSELLTDEDEENDRHAFVGALSLTDRDAAVAFIEEVVIPPFTSNGGTVETVTGGDYQGYELRDEDGELTYLVVFADVMFVSASDQPLPLDGFPSDTLADEASFTGALAQLPAEQYNAVFYIDTPAFIEVALEQDPDLEALGLPQIGRAGVSVEMLEDTGATVVGATTFGERTLVLDVVQLFETASTVTSAPVDPGFARFIPAGTPLVIHSSNLAGTFNTALSTLTMLAEETDPDANAEDQIQFAQSFISGFVGLDVQTEILGWMTGDYAVVAGLSDEFSTAIDTSGELAALPFEFGLLVEATDATAADNVVTALQRVLENAAEDSEGDLRVTSEAVGSTEMVVITIENPDTPFPIELALGANADVFALGTVEVVRFALNPDGGLDSDPRFIDAAAHVLPNAEQVWYLTGEPLLELPDVLAVRFQAQNNDADGLRRLLTAFYSSSISTITNAEGAMITRVAMTLPE